MLSACKSVHWESFQCKIMVTCESTAEEVSYEWSHYNYDFVNMIFIVRTCLHSITPVSIADVNCPPPPPPPYSPLLGLT